MMNLENAISDTLEELELEQHIDYHIHEVVENRLYNVTFQEKRNGNNDVIISVEYSSDIGNLMNDDEWEGEIEVKIVRRHGVSSMTAQVIMELLAITLDDDYFESDEEEEDSDDETLSTASQPLTPPPSRVRLA